jgi:hypothetical protein
MRYSRMNVLHAQLFSYMVPGISALAALDVKYEAYGISQTRPLAPFRQF